MRSWVLALFSVLVAPPSRAADSTEPILTTLCEIVKSPERFDGKKVSIRATVIANFEASILNDNTCGSDASVWLSYGDERRTPSAAAEAAPIVSLADLKRPDELKWRSIQSDPLITVKTDSEFKRLDSYLSKQFKPTGKNVCISCPLYSVAATFTGRLDYADNRLKAYRDKDGKVIGAGGGGFGHLGSWNFRLVMESVSHVVATKIDPSIYEPKK